MDRPNKFGVTVKPHVILPMQYEINIPYFGFFDTPELLLTNRMQWAKMRWTCNSYPGSVGFFGPNFQGTFEVIAASVQSFGVGLTPVEFSTFDSTTNEAVTMKKYPISFLGPHWGGPVVTDPRRDIDVSFACDVQKLFKTVSGRLTSIKLRFTPDWDYYLHTLGRSINLGSHGEVTVLGFTSTRGIYAKNDYDSVSL